jgi:hypothetical protein
VEMGGLEPPTSWLQTTRSPSELHPRWLLEMGVLGFEPRTSALSELRSSQLSYTPAENKKAKPGQVWPYPRLKRIERHPVSFATV